MRRGKLRIESATALTARALLTTAFAAGLIVAPGCAPSSERAPADSAEKKEAHKRDNSHAAHGEHPHWGYGREDGPARWSELSPHFSLCSTGKHQSPIDITAAVSATVEPLKLDYRSASLDVVNNGHTIQFDYEPGSTLTVDGRQFALKQLHFHAPSETKINGKSFPLEAHLVHLDDKGGLAVVAVLFSPGQPNAQLEKLWQHLPDKAGQRAASALEFDVDALLPETGSYYRYSGSLTTPPCSEGVRWFVIEAPGTVASAQVERFSSAIGHANNRPVQALNARIVLRR